MGNGHDHDTYSWTQTLGDLSLAVPVPPGTKGRGCNVSITRNRLKVCWRLTFPAQACPCAHMAKPISRLSGRLQPCKKHVAAGVDQ